MTVAGVHDGSAETSTGGHRLTTFGSVDEPVFENPKTGRGADGRSVPPAW